MEAILNISKIEHYLNEISEILILSRKLVTDSRSMLLPGNSATFSIIDNNKFLTRTRESLWKLGIIELAKLYGKKQYNNHYSLIILLNELKSNYDKLEWKNKISINQIEKLLISLYDEISNKKIIELFNLRDKLYAHTDKDRNSYEFTLFFEGCIYLIEIAEEIIESLSNKILEKPIQFLKYNGEDAKEFFKNHLEYISLAGKYTFQNK